MIDEKGDKKYSALSYLDLGSNISGNKLSCIFWLKFQTSHLRQAFFFIMEYRNFIKYIKINYFPDLMAVKITIY